MDNSKTYDLGKVTKSPKKSYHVPSTLQADTLFTFCGELEWILEPLRNKMLSPRYCIEDIGYLSLNNIKKIAIPMKCFCDINLHRLETHLNCYGYYGLAFSKAWGMEKKIQPIQYINKSSYLCSDFKKAFNASLNDAGKDKNLTQKKLQNYMLHQLMYCKPYSGKFKNRVTNKNINKCFTDECEWRFVPDVTSVGFEQIYFDEDILNSGNLTTTISDSLSGIPEISLKFEYSDIKYIIISSINDFNKVTSEISKFDISDEEKNMLISKIIIWDNEKGDF